MVVVIVAAAVGGGGGRRAQPTDGCNESRLSRERRDWVCKSSQVKLMTRMDGLLSCTTDRSTCPLRYRQEESRVGSQGGEEEREPGGSQRWGCPGYIMSLQLYRAEEADRGQEMGGNDAGRMVRKRKGVVSCK